MNYTQNAYLGPKSSPCNPLVHKLMNIRDPANTFTFADEGPFVEPGFNTQGLNDTALFPIWPSSDAPGWVQNRIAGKGNCAFADGHVAPASRMDSFPLAWPR